MAESQPSVVRQEITQPTLGSNKLYPNISVHNSCMGSLWCNSVNVVMEFHLECKLHFPSAGMLRLMHL